MAIYFYKEFGPLGYLASYSLHGFYKDGIYWKTVEHYYQAQKFESDIIRQKIANALTPKEASNIGRDRNNRIRDNWNDIKKEVMYTAVYCKFKAHPEIAQKLLDTDNEEIIEETTRENYWGCGPNRDGENNYGKILCHVRKVLRIEKEQEEARMMYYITQRGYEELYRKFLNVDNEILDTNKKIGESVKRDNDLRENPEFMQLRVKAMYELPQKKERLLKKCKEAIIIEDMESYKKFDGQTVIIGSIVEISFNGENCRYTILGTDEGDIEEDILSCDAPIARVLLGKCVGDIVIFNDMVISILSIKKYVG